MFAAAAQFTFLQDDVGVPKNYRHMEGFGVHTYTLVNKAGKVTYVKFHWQPACGAREFLDGEFVYGIQAAGHGVSVRSISGG